ncbi:hypothetical protein RHO12_12345 [Orbus sturtevantii]|uniref:phosphotriesterase family protein n=1 Tax=Orbus sturtevantii TaxID=3074109 RepID=UPI00370D7F47
MTQYVQTVLGPVEKSELGIILPHEHLFNDLSSVVDQPFYHFSARICNQNVSPNIQWALKQDPYCCADNMAKKEIINVVNEVNNFKKFGGKTIVDATGSASIGRDIESMKVVAEKTGLNIIAATGLYLEKFEQERIKRPIDIIAKEIDSDLRIGIDGSNIKAGLIGEIGISPSFTVNEKNSLQAAGLAQLNNKHIAINVHLPGWLRVAHDVLDILIEDVGVEPQKISLAHCDPSGIDYDYQKSLLDRGVWLEFDMIGLDITFPKEGVSPTVNETVEAVHNLIISGYQNQLLLSHDLFLKQMWAQNGGNGWAFVPNVFLSLLERKGISSSITKALCTINPANLLT